jgi:hypothetical protein
MMYLMEFIKWLKSMSTTMSPIKEEILAKVNKDYLSKKLPV